MAKRKGKAAPQPRGRPTKLTPDVQRRICEVLRETTATLEEAVRYVGVAPSTFQAWCALGREGRAPFLDFLEAVQGAREDRLVHQELQIARAGRSDWRARAWLLERTAPKKYAQRVRVHVEEELTDALERIRKRVPEDVFEQVLAAIVEGDSREGAGEDSVGEDGPHHPAGGEAVQPPQP